MLSSSAYPSTTYAIFFSIAFWAWILFEFWVFFRERGAARDRSSDRGSASLVIVLLIVGITAGLNLPQLAPQFNIRSLFPFFFALGIVLVFAGLLFRFWAIQTLGQFFRTQVMIQQEHRLITTGPYTYLRNPSYTAILVLLTGLGLAIGNWLSAVVLLATGILAYGLRIARVEERALAERFGQEFQDYRKKTWALIPFIW